MRKRKGTAIFGMQLLSACFLAAICVLLITTCYLEGDIKALRPTVQGTDGNLYEVKDEETLRKVGKGDGWEMDSHYIQIQDIYLDEYTDWTPICNGNEFTGVFDGKGYSIYYLHINSSNIAQGLFSTIGSGGVVENVNLINVEIVVHNSNTGAVAGVNKGIVKNCGSTGIIEGDQNVGGIVGLNEGSTSEVENCYSASDVTGIYRTGGLAGHNYGSVSKCYSTGIITGEDDVGGIVGLNEGSGMVDNCYTTGNVIGNNNCAGGIVGKNSNAYGNTTIQFCYTTGNIDGNNFVGGVAGGNSPSCSIKKCVALGISVTCDNENISRIGRVIGENDNGNSQDNYARINMQVNGEAKDNENIDPPKDGTNVDDRIHDGGDGGYHDEGFYTDTMGWLNFENVWEMGPHDLPILKGFPEGTQDPKIQDIVP